ncbi:MAG: His/Gly/Thr/Pro-type tRNA ligase C-terminal domain-containing protein, partial [cyanobacterium endosymbiont of Rhopalodia inflata]
IQDNPNTSPDLYIVSKGKKGERKALVIAQNLRHEGLTVELDLSGGTFGKQFKRADRSGAIACLVLGDTEAETHTVQLKWLASKEQSTLTQEELISQIGELKEQLARHNI